MKIKRKVQPGTASLLSIVNRNKIKILVPLFTCMIACAFTATLPLLIGQLFGILNNTLEKNKLVLILVLIVVFSILHTLFFHSSALIGTKLFIPILTKYKRLTFERAWGYEYKDFIDKPSGKIASCVNDIYLELYTLYELMFYRVVDVIAKVSVFAVTLSIIAWQNVVIYGVFIIVANYILSMIIKQIRVSNSKTADLLADNKGRVFDSFSNFVTVFSFNQKKKEFLSLSKKDKKLTKQYTESELVIKSFWATGSAMLRTTLWPIVIIYNYHLFSQHKISITEFGTSLTILIAFTDVYFPLAEVVSQYSKLSSSFNQKYVYLFGNENIVKEQKEIEEKIVEVPNHFNKKIEIKNLSFAYPDNKNTKVLEDINLTINKNEKIGIVGQTGGGKSTIVKLLLGFYADQESKIVDDIFIDGKPATQSYLNNLIAYIPQDTALFQESIKFNITYGTHSDLLEEEIVEVAKKARADDFISKLPKKYETVVGERGIKLSMGQRQRIAIARAFVKNADILILDEATSALDSITEKKIQKALEQLWEDKTVIAIAHRLSTINNVDRIVVVENGKIVEHGTKEELLDSNNEFSYFKNLWQQQKDGML